MSESWKDKQYLLVVLAILLLLKFLVVPIFEWQTTKLSEIKLQTNKASKFAAAAENSENFKTLALESQNELSKLTQLIHPVQDINQFQIDTQRELNTLFSSSGISVQRFNWEFPLEIPDSQLIKMTAQINFESSVESFLAFREQYLAQQEWMGIERFNYRFEATNRGKLLPDVKGQMHVIMFMKGKE